MKPATSLFLGRSLWATQEGSGAGAVFVAWSEDMRAELRDAGSANLLQPGGDGVLEGGRAVVMFVGKILPIPAQ